MVVPVAQAYDTQNVTHETLRERAIKIAEEFTISTTTFTNLISSENHEWDPKAYNKETGDRGLLQLSERWHPEVLDSCAYNAECSMRFAAQRIKDGYISDWTVANCYAYVSLFVRLPKMAEIVPNTTPFVGAVAIFNYSGVKHIAYIKELRADGFLVREANYRPAVVAEREVDWKDKALVGFWTSNQSLVYR